MLLQKITNVKTTKNFAATSKILATTHNDILSDKYNTKNVLWVIIRHTQNLKLQEIDDCRMAHSCKQLHGIADW